VRVLETSFGKKKDDRDPEKDFLGCSKIFGCKAHEIMRSEPYLSDLRSDK
jgi:hypothetical protein